MFKNGYKSRKFLWGIAVCLLVSVGTFLGKVEIQQWLDFLEKMTYAYFGANALTKFPEALGWLKEKTNGTNNGDGDPHTIRPTKRRTKKRRETTTQP